MDLSSDEEISAFFAQNPEAGNSADRVPILRSLLAICSRPKSIAELCPVGALSSFLVDILCQNIDEAGPLGAQSLGNNNSPLTALGGLPSHLPLSLPALQSLENPTSSLPPPPPPGAPVAWLSSIDMQSLLRILPPVLAPPVRVPLPDAGPTIMADAPFHSLMPHCGQAQVITDRPDPGRVPSEPPQAGHEVAVIARVLDLVDTAEPLASHACALLIAVSRRFDSATDPLPGMLELHENVRIFFEGFLEALNADVPGTTATLGRMLNHPELCAKLCFRNTTTLLVDILLRRLGALEPTDDTAFELLMCLDGLLRHSDYRAIRPFYKADEVIDMLRILGESTIPAVQELALSIQSQSRQFGLSPFPIPPPLPVKGKEKVFDDDDGDDDGDDDDEDADDDWRVFAQMMGGCWSESPST
ncbi:hypothetical protein PAPYR_9583 [Paratrimastix pyriformis]|uniref:SPIN90/Ldb17 leucine-rich domain-containing protein n=1 Tax=Paratrimastix pyriformis TaxID=342808 RepID=A0ABQ8UAI8_9EUKA|nr:hypothetical protein PAPYR_9583 [Paratrimastix pyriformis]